jgi:UDP-glucuronate decarboxylase
MTIRWITDYLGTAPADSPDINIGEVDIIDVRDLVDKAGNTKALILEKINQAVMSLSRQKKTIICCDYGISRSNAIAAGVVSLHYQMPFNESVGLVLSKTREREIKLEVLNVVRGALYESTKLALMPSKQRILVTGSTGFLGKHLCLDLKKRYEIFELSRADINLEEGATQLALFTEVSGIDSIIHLASPRIYTSNIALGKTLAMLRNVLEVCSSQNISLIYPSSWEVYSGYKGKIFVDESVPLNPRGPYGESKYLAELLIEHFRNTAGLRCALLRSSPLYGFGSDKPKFIHNFIQKCKNSALIKTHRYLNGDPGLDLMHVTDFVNAISRAYSKQYFGNLNFGTGEITTTFEIAKYLKEALGSSSEIQHSSVELHAPSIAMNASLARSTLGWSPSISLCDGLSQLAESS